MHRLGIVLGDGELGLFDHRLQGVLGQGEALGVAQAGQLGIVSGIHAQNGELGAAAPDLGEQLVVACHEYLAAFQLADHLTEQPGAENDAALFGYRSGDHGGDAQFQVVAGEGEGIPFRPDQNAFQGLESGAGGHRPGYIGDRGREHGLVAGKLHLKNLPFSTAP